MKINNVIFNQDLITILTELKKQLYQNNIHFFSEGFKESSNDYQCQCPFHKDGKERRPSAGIRKEDGLFHCFTCNETHSLQEVISYCFGKYEIGGMWGWNWLLTNFGSVSIEQRKPIEIDFGRNKIIVESNEKRYFTSEAELDSYRVIHPYWKERGVEDRMLEVFDLGYDQQTDCITFNVRDKEGRSLFIARRSVKGKFFNYPKDVEKGLYGIYELYQLKEFPKTVYICESMIDCILLNQQNKPAVAMNGLGSIKQYEQLNEMSCRKFVLATDSDEAGQNARKRLKEKIKGKMITEVILPKGRKDIGECTKEEIEGLEEVW